MKELNLGALVRLKNARHLLTKNQYDALARKIRNGDPDGAMKKLRMLLLLQGSNAVKNDVSRGTRNIKK